MMNRALNQDNIESYKFHHIDTNKCRQCKDFSCEEVEIEFRLAVVDLLGGKLCFLLIKRLLCQRDLN